MTFFDKLFTIKNRTPKAENGYKLAIEPLRSSVFEIAKDQIRVVLFSECDRRGRKLLFDSNAVEKLPLASHIKPNDYLCKAKCDKMHNGKLFDFVDVTCSHGYKYKKPSSDVTLLGEMIFGSVAMVFKGGSTCKIHTLSSPKCLMFTNIIHAPGQCHFKLSSDSFIGMSAMNARLSSETSLNDCSNDKRISSSDSKLYRTQTSSKCGTSTYPCMKQKSDVRNLSNLSEIEKCCSEVGQNAAVIENDNDLKKININSRGHSERITNLDSKLGCERMYESEKDSVWKCSELNQDFSEKTRLGHCICPPSTTDTFCDFYECKRDIFSKGNDLNSSVGGLRRRWMQSCSSSVDEIQQEEMVVWKSKTRTKLGMGLVVDLSRNLDNELEKFLFNHSIIIESILKNLQSSVESAYVKKENFVDLIYSAFINCQQSMFELINGGKYARPMWLTLIENQELETGSEVLNKIYSQFQENIKDCRKQDALNNIQLKFLSDFCDILVKFDTKDTNFFISTLVTAVLTHHLSWVTGIAESDSSLPQYKLQSKLKGAYNPIWAQLNDLNGILGSPLKSARTMITGSEDRKNSIASIIQVLTYFIRCYNVVENVYDYEFEEITRIEDGVLKYMDKNVNDLRDCNGGNYSSCVSANVKNTEKKLCDTETANLNKLAKIHIPSKEDIQENHKCIKEGLQKNCSQDGIEQSENCLFQSERVGSCIKSTAFYSNIEEMSKYENVGFMETDEKNCVFPVDNCSKEENFTEKVQKLIRVPSKAVLCHLEQNFVQDESYNKTMNSCTISDVDKESISARKMLNKDDVLFVLGENEELVNLNKAVLTKTFKNDVEGEESKNLTFECRNVNLRRSDSFNIPPSIAEESKVRCRPFDNDFTEKDVAISERYPRLLEKESVLSLIQELPMPRVYEKNHLMRRLDISSVLGSVNEHYNSEQIIQGVLEDKSQWEKALQRDLALYSHNPVLDRNVTEALCIIGDMNSWEVSLFSNRNFSMDKRNFTGIRIGMSQLVADMLESLLHICRVKLPPDFCLEHIEKKLREIYTKSKSLAELLNSTDMCSMEYLTSRLNISVNDVPLLLSVATTHSPHISSKYGLTFT